MTYWINWVWNRVGKNLSRWFEKQNTDRSTTLLIIVTRVVCTVRTYSRAHFLQYCTIPRTGKMIITVKIVAVLGIICVCWITGLLIGFMPLMGWRAVEGPMLESCEFSRVMDYNYLVFLYLATIILPALFMATSYAHIYTVIIKQVSDDNTERFR